MSNIPIQVSILDEIEKMENKDAPVEIKRAINIKTLKEFEVSCSYGDIVLIIAMLRDYVKGLDEIKDGEILWEVYYRKKFLEIANRLSEQIDYDYDKALKNCLKSAEKESKSDIGGEAISLMLKRGR